MLKPIVMKNNDKHLKSNSDGTWSVKIKNPKPKCKYCLVTLNEKLICPKCKACYTLETNVVVLTGGGGGIENDL